MLIAGMHDRTLVTRPLCKAVLRCLSDCLVADSWYWRTETGRPYRLRNQRATPAEEPDDRPPRGLNGVHHFLLSLYREMSIPTC